MYGFETEVIGRKTTTIHENIALFTVRVSIVARIPDVILKRNLVYIVFFWYNYLF